MRRRFAAVATIVVCQSLLIAGGCGRGSWSSGEAASRPSGVAVVDLDEVAKQLGTDVALVKAINSGQASLNQQLQTFQATLQQKFQEKTQEQQTRSTAPESQKQLAGIQREMNLQLNEARRTAQTELTAYRQRLIQQFRSEVAPVAQSVAAKRGLGVVVTKNDTVLLTFDDAHDITAEVVATLRAKQPDAAPATASQTPPSDSIRR